MVRSWAFILFICSIGLNLSCRREEHPGTDINISDSNAVLTQEFALSNITELKIRQMSISGALVSLEVADETQSLHQGLMFRDSLAENSGMLFIFPTDGLRPFWMKNTYIPLSIAFITADGEIIGIDTMQPLDSVTKHIPREPYRYAIEMDAGWFAKHGVKVGDKLSIPDK
jgi:uncharacterized membrane protein (UPF0127 family)